MRKRPILRAFAREIQDAAVLRAVQIVGGRLSDLEEDRAASQEREKALAEALEFIAGFQNLVFAECSDAEAIVGTARKALAAYRSEHTGQEKA